MSADKSEPTPHPEPHGITPPPSSAEIHRRLEGHDIAHHHEAGQDGDGPSTEDRRKDTVDE